jgi:hypothetical protein
MVADIYLLMKYAKAGPPASHDDGEDPALEGEFSFLGAQD